MPPQTRRTRKSLFIPCIAAVAAIFTLSACSAKKGTKSGGSLTPPEFYGYVLRVAGKDTVPAASARVWTDPASDVATTGTNGYWSIASGLVPGRYRVVAEFEGVMGRSAPVTATLGRTDTVFVVIGSTETPWPPIIDFIRMLPALTKGGGIIR